MSRFLLALREFFRKLTAPIRWTWTLFRGLIGPPLRAVRRVVDRIFDFFEWLVEKIIELWGRLWKSARHPEKVRDEYVGVNGVPLLAALTLFGTWYVFPIARVLEIGQTRFILLAVTIWIVALVSWRSRCREDRRGPVAQWVQTVAHATGLRRLDQIGLLLAGTLCWLARAEAQLWPLAGASVVAFVALLIQEHEPRPSLSVYALPNFPTLPAGSPSDSESSSGQLTDVTLHWSMDLQGQVRHHSAVVAVSVARLTDAKNATPKYSADIADLVHWVVRGACPEVEQLARQIHDQVFQGGYSLYAAVSCFAAACQSIPYRLDVDSTGHEEYWRYPIETLGDGEGDCEDTSVLLAALLRRAGFSCALLHFPGHVAVGVQIPDDVPGTYLDVDGRNYYYCETTATGWRVGDAPQDCVGLPVNMFPIPPMGLK